MHILKSYCTSSFHLYKVSYITNTNDEKLYSMNENIYLHMNEFYTSTLCHTKLEKY